MSWVKRISHDCKSKEVRASYIEAKVKTEYNRYMKGLIDLLSELHGAGELRNIGTKEFREMMETVLL